MFGLLTWNEAANLHDQLSRPQLLATSTRTLSAHQPSLHNITALHESNLGSEALSITDCPREGRA